MKNINNVEIGWIGCTSCLGTNKNTAKKHPLEGGGEVPQRIPSAAKNYLKAIPGNFYRHRVLRPIVH